MRNSITLGITACSLAVAASGIASADLLVGNYSVNGFTTSSTCPNVAGSPQKGQASVATVIYPGANKVGLVLANPATTATSKAGGGATQVCLANTKVPAAGLNNATIGFKCYNDTVTGPAKTVLAQFSAHFKVGATHNKEVSTVEVATTLTSPISCKFTADSTYSHN